MFEDKIQAQATPVKQAKKNGKKKRKAWKEP